MAARTSKRRAAGEGSVFRDATGKRWIGFLDLGADAAGKRRRRKVTGRTRADVLDALRAARKDLDEGRPLGARRDTVTRLLQDFYNRGLPATVRSENTRYGYGWAIEHHLIPALGGRKLRDLSADDVDEMLRIKADAGLGQRSLSHIHQVLTRALRWAERRGRVARNVAALVDTPRGGRRPSRAFTVEEAHHLLEAAAGDRLEAAWVVMLLLGTRPGETFALTWSAVDLDDGVIEVRASLRRDQRTNKLTIADTKTEHSRRRLDAPLLVLDALRTHRRRQAAERLAAGPAWTEKDLVFTNEVGGPLDPSATRRRFKRVAANAGLGDRHPHECRHSVASILSAHGVPLEQIADVLGHDGTRVTEQVYRHVITPSIVSAKAPMDAVFRTG